LRWLACRSFAEMGAKSALKSIYHNWTKIREMLKNDPFDLSSVHAPACSIARQVRQLFIYLNSEIFHLHD
jgi:hypothetical protein